MGLSLEHISFVAPPLTVNNTIGIESRSKELDTWITFRQEAVHVHVEKFDQFFISLSWKIFLRRDLTLTLISNLTASA